GVPVKVAAPRNLAAARFYTTTPAMFDGGYEENFERLKRQVKWPQYSCDCYAYGLLALGWIDLVVERQLKAHDIVGLVPIITGAGGFAGDWNGNEIGLETDGTMIAASSKALALEALAILQAGKNGKAA
ncbi:MAG: inositol monophosphatase family protein, partial [Bdellovibrionales bacterium]